MKQGRSVDWKGKREPTSSDRKIQPILGLDPSASDEKETLEKLPLCKILNNVTPWSIILENGEAAMPSVSAMKSENDVDAGLYGSWNQCS